MRPPGLVAPSTQLSSSMLKEKNPHIKLPRLPK